MKAGFPVVAILGRPNVGKSTLFNRLTKEKKAIVEDIPAVTRDRIYTLVNYFDKNFFLVDTGGFETKAEDEITKLTKKQIEFAIIEADLVILLLDVRSGLLFEDKDIFRLLKEKGKKVIVAVNKVDSEKLEKDAFEFYELGVDKIFPISALSGRKVDELIKEIIRLLPKVETKKGEEGIKIAIVGRPNVGKSTLFNALVGEERVIVDNTPGTTRDAIDTRIRVGKKYYTLIDTAGIRKKSKISSNIEKYSILRAIKSIERADIVLLMLDAREVATSSDKKIASIALKYNKAIMILVNKWDLVEEKDRMGAQFLEYIRREFDFINFAPIIPISALYRKRLGGIFPLIDEIYAEYTKRVPTHLLNKVIEKATKAHYPPVYKGRRLKVYYATQIGIAPPKILLFVNYPEGFSESYIRYLKNRIREEFLFKGSPIEIKLKKRE